MSAEVPEAASAEEQKVSVPAERAGEPARPGAVAAGGWAWRRPGPTEGEGAQPEPARRRCRAGVPLLLAWQGQTLRNRPPAGARVVSAGVVRVGGSRRPG